MPEYNRPVSHGDGKICSGCGVLVFNQMQHDTFHSDIADALLEHGQLREELARADLLAAGNGTRADAAIRVAEAARALHENRGKRGMETEQVHKEFVAALELWEQVR